MKRYLFCAILFSLVISGTGFAGDNQSGDRESAAMDEVVVTASRVLESKKDLATQVTVIDEEAIANSSATNLGDLLAETGAVTIRKYPGALTAIGIRGFRTESHGNNLKSHVLILLDGRPVTSSNVAAIMTDNIARVEVIKGPASVQYGTRAMGGVVNVITKKTESGPSFFVETKAGSFDFRENKAGFSGKVDKLDLSTSFSRSSMDDYKTGDSDRYHNTGYDSKNTVNFSAGYELVPGHRIGMAFARFDANGLGSPSYLSKTDLEAFTERTNRDLDFTYDGKTANDTFNWHARYFTADNEYDYFMNAAASPFFTDIDTTGTQAQVTGNFNSTVVTTGVEWVKYEISRSSRPKSSEYANTSGFVLAKQKFFDDKLIMTGGLRYDSFELELIDPSGTDENNDNVSPSIGLAYNINKHLKLRANYAEAFVTPEADQLAADYVSGGKRYVGNPDLDPQKSKTWETGADVYFKNFTSSLTYFSTDFDDHIVSYTKANGDNSWKNLGSTDISGIEGEFRGYIRNVLPYDLEINPYLAFSRLFEYEDNESGEDLLYTPETDLSCGITVTNLDDFSADLSVIYTGSSDVEDYENWNWPDPVSVVELDSSTVANLTVTKRVYQSENKGSVTLRGEVTNLTDEDYAYVKGYPMPGRAYYMSVRFDY